MLIKAECPDCGKVDVLSRSLTLVEVSSLQGQIVEVYVAWQCPVCMIIHAVRAVKDRLTDIWADLKWDE